MICEKCKKNKATVKIVKIVADEKIEQSLCVKCAFGVENSKSNDTTNNMSNDDRKKSKNFDMNKLMGNLLNHIDLDIEENLEISTMNEYKDKKCDICGMTYDEIKRTGIIGCGHCYKIFKIEIEDRIRAYQGMNQIRKKKKYNFISEDKKSIADLECELREAIEYEEYEKAAIIRDTIKQLKNIGRENE